MVKFILCFERYYETSFLLLYGILFRLLRTKWDMALTSFFIEHTATVWAFQIPSCLLLSLSVLLWCHFLLSSAFGSSDGSQGLALSLPFRHFLIGLHLLDFLVDDCSFLHQFQLLFGYYSLSLCVKFFSLALKHLLTYLLVFIDAIRIEFSAAACRTLDQFTRIVLLNL